MVNASDVRQQEPVMADVPIKQSGMRRRLRKRFTANLAVTT